ncbi:FAD-dependent monooxygenase [Streptomyces sp. NPDC127197]|uniref:FAD-dependent monooxygenase n=1 Tax=Streptomyces sp. NPDC127197 TaxID=3345388 RepID=UPI0036317246
MPAYELTLAGIPVVVLEKQRTRGTQCRAGGLQPRAAEVVDLRGLLEPLLSHRNRPRTPPAGISPPCRSSWTAGLAHPVPPSGQASTDRLEAHLERILGERGVPVLRGHEVTALAQDAEGVTIEWHADGAPGGGEDPGPLPRRVRRRAQHGPPAPFRERRPRRPSARLTRFGTADESLQSRPVM